MKVRIGKEELYPHYRVNRSEPLVEIPEDVWVLYLAALRVFEDARSKVSSCLRSERE